MMKPTLTLLVCALMINYATCLMCLVGVDDKAVATDCLTLTKCYSYSKTIPGTTTYGCDDDSKTKCVAERTAQGGGGICIVQGNTNVPTPTTPTKGPNSASDIAATKLMIIPSLVLILKRFF